MYYFVPSLVNHATDEEKKEEEEAKARATAGKCHDSIISVNMITADVGVMGLHHC